MRIRRRFIVAQNSYRRRANRRRAKLKTFDYIFNRAYIAVLRSGIAGLTLGLHYLSFEAMREHAQDVAAVIDDIERLNSLQQAAYEKCESGFDWSDRGRSLYNAIRQAMNRRPPAERSHRC